MWEELLNQGGVPGPPGGPQTPVAQAPSMDAIVNNPAQGMMIGPPKGQEEFQARKAQWGQTLDALMQDPNFKATMLYMGTRMMQPLRPGQTPMGHIGNAVGEGMNFLAGKEEVDRKRGMEDKRFGLETRKANADIQTAEMKQKQAQAEMDEFERTQHQRDTKRELELTQLEADIKDQGETRDLRRVERSIALMEQEMKITERSEFMSPAAAKQRQRLNELKVELEEARVKHERAATAASTRSNTDRPSDTDKAIQRFVDDPMWNPDIKDPKSRARLAQDALTKKATGTAAADVQLHAARKKTLMQLGWPEVEAEQGAWTWIDEGEMPKRGKISPDAGKTRFELGADGKYHPVK